METEMEAVEMTGFRRKGAPHTMEPQQKGSQAAQEAVRKEWGRRELTRAFRVRSVNEATGYFLLFIMGTLTAEDLT